jgi:hypothetical protein
VLFNEICIKSMQLPSAQSYNINMKSVEPKAKHAIISGQSKASFKPQVPKPPVTPGVGHYKDADRKDVSASDKH